MTTASASLGRFDRRTLVRSAAVVAGLFVYYSFDWLALQRVWHMVFASTLAALGHQVQALDSGTVPYLVVDTKKFLLSRNCTYVDFALVLTPLVWQPRRSVRSNVSALVAIGVALALFNWLRVVVAIHLNVTRDLSWQRVHFWPDFLLHIGVIVSASLHALWSDWQDTISGKLFSMRKLGIAMLLVLVSTTAQAQINAGEQKPEASLPFTMTQVAEFKLGWRLAFLPDGRMLVTEKVGPVWLVTQKGEKTPVANVPPVLWQGQGGMLGIFLSPKYATDHNVYLTYSEPGDQPGASSLALARARLALDAGSASLEGLQVLWRDMPKGRGGQFGAQIAFSPDGQFLFLTVGDRQRMTPAQDPNTEVGKILRLTLDGKPAPGNPMAGKTGGPTRPLINPPRDTEAAKTAPVVETYTVEGKNLAPAETWVSGVRTPYGLAFAPDGRLWEVEHGPRGGDELNLIEPGKNYGWPLVSYAVNYNGVPIPSPDTRADLAKPVIYWTPIIAPGNIVFYNGAMFPQWKGSALVGGMQSQTLNRIVFDGKGGAKPAERWDVGHRIRDVEVGPDGALWMLEDKNPGGLFRVTPK